MHLSILYKILNITSLLLLVLATTPIKAQEIQNFSLTDVTEKKAVSLNQYSSIKGVVIIFTSNSCPFDQYYIKRIKNLSETFKGRIQFLLVNSHPETEESEEAMSRYSHEQNLMIPYLADKKQQVLSQFNARKSPEVFLLKNTTGKFTVVYHGMIDNNAQSESDVTEYYLKDAMDELLAGDKIEVVETRPVGCSIRKN